MCELTNIKEILTKWKEEVCLNCGVSVKGKYLQIDGGYFCENCNTFISDNDILEKLYSILINSVN